jgi:hypothetical protein
MKLHKLARQKLVCQAHNVPFRKGWKRKITSKRSQACLRIISRHVFKLISETNWSKSQLGMGDYAMSTFVVPQGIK